MTQSEAAAAAKSFRDTYPNQSISYGFTKSEIQSLVTSTTIGLRLYVGIVNGEFCLIPVAVDSSGNDIVPTDFINSKPCPACCSSTNILNS